MANFKRNHDNLSLPEESTGPSLLEIPPDPFMAEDEACTTNMTLERILYCF